MVEYLTRPPGMPPTNGYSHAVLGTGTMLVISGQLPLDEEGRLVGEHDPSAQATQTFENVSLALAAAGATFANVVRLGFFLTDLEALPAVRAARDAFVDPKRAPASSLVQVAGLAVRGAIVEIEALALV
jgi:enamine deaminase RidA (YjgF/YER057c/UK114 family)